MKNDNNDKNKYFNRKINDYMRVLSKDFHRIHHIPISIVSLYLYMNIINNIIHKCRLYFLKKNK